MKRLIVFMLCVCVVIPSLLFTSYAETLQGESDENITEERQKEYDSVNIPDSEKEKIIPWFQKQYEFYIDYYDGEDEASSELGYDIQVLNEETGFMKVYYGYDPRNDLISGVHIDNIVQNAIDNMEYNVYVKPASDEILLLYQDTYDDILAAPEKQVKSYRAYMSYYKHIHDVNSLFSSVESTKKIKDMTVQQIYIFQVAPPIFIYRRPMPVIAYISTNKGDFVLYRYDKSLICNEYLLPVEEFISLTKKMFEIEAFYGDITGAEDENCLEGIIDLSDYLVGEDRKTINNQYNIYPFFENDPDFIGLRSKYHFIKGIGLESVSQFRDLLLQIDPAYRGVFSGGGVLDPGYISWWDFLRTMTDAGCTTYDECRAYIDAAIEERKNPPPVTNTPSGGGDMTQNNPADSGDGKSNAFLFWLIPSVLVVLAAAVAIFILKKKKKA